MNAQHTNTIATVTVRCYGTRHKCKNSMFVSLTSNERKWIQRTEENPRNGKFHFLYFRGLFVALSAFEIQFLCIGENNDNECVMYIKSTNELQNQKWLLSIFVHVRHSMTFLDTLIGAVYLDVLQPIRKQCSGLSQNIALISKAQGENFVRCLKICITKLKYIFHFIFCCFFWLELQNENSFELWMTITIAEKQLVFQVFTALWFKIESCNIH